MMGWTTQQEEGSQDDLEVGHSLLWGVTSFHS
jgi:hypothetical protein